MHDPRAGLFCCLLSSKGRMVQQFINVVVGQSCCRSVTWRDRTTHGSSDVLLWSSDCCHRYVMWSTEGLEESPSAGGIPPWAVRAQSSHQILWIFHRALRPNSFCWLQKSSMAFDFLTTLNWAEMRRCHDITGKLLRWATKLIENLESACPVSIPYPFPVILTKKRRCPSLRCWGLEELTGWNEIRLGGA